VPATGSLALLVGTRKGAFILHSNAKRREWRLAGPHFLGSTVHHIVLDPHDRRTMLCAARAGHFGPTVFRSVDMGRTWKEAAKPPAFPKAKEGEKGLAVDHLFWLTPGHPSEPGVWYAGTSPQGLFRSADGGVNWEGVAGFNAHPLRAAWCGDEQASPPDGATLHSINIDPRDPKHLYIGMSCGGTFESPDGGSNWAPLNKGSIADFLPNPNPEYGQAGDQVPYSIGMGFSLNDRVSLSMAMAGAAIRRREINGNEISGSGLDINSLQFTTTVQLAKRVYVEPFVGFGLTDEAADFLVGINIPVGLEGRFPLPF